MFHILPWLIYVTNYTGTMGMCTSTVDTHLNSCFGNPYLILKNSR